MSMLLLQKDNFSFFAQLALSLLVIVSIISNSVLFVSWVPVTSVLYSVATENNTAFSSLSQRTSLVTQTLEYLHSPAIQEWTLLLNDEELNLMESERQHMADVKNLFFKVKLIARVSTFLLLVISVLIYRYNKNLFKSALTIVSALLLILPLGLLVGIILFWNFSFTLFHQLLFAKGSWSFPADSTTIQLFPEQFWIAIFVSYLVMMLGIGGVIRFVINSLPSSEGRTSSEHLEE